MDAILVFTTVPDQAVADKISHHLVDHGLAACVHQFAAGRSIFRWQGKLETASEMTLMIKSRRTKHEAIEHAIRELHPYDTPEIIMTDVVGGSADYLEWITRETSP
jgi:periplasmic divalent cation tolerance protein